MSLSTFDRCFALRRSPPGRALVALRGVGERAQAFGLDDINRLVGKATDAVAESRV